MEAFAGRPPKDLQGYRALQRQSILNRVDFWRDQGMRLKWEKGFSSVVAERFSGAPEIAWFPEGQLNACVNALDVVIGRGHGARPALKFLDRGRKLRTYSYQQVFDEVVRIARALSAWGLGQGDRLVLYLPDCAEEVFFTLAAARLGLTYVPVPPMFAAEQVQRIAENCQASRIVVSVEGSAPYKQQVEDLARQQHLSLVAVGKGSLEGATPLATLLARGATVQDPGFAVVGAEHPLFLAFGGLAMGIPRGSIKATAGVLVQAACAHDFVLGMLPSNSGQRSLWCEIDLAATAAQSIGLWGTLVNGQCLVLASAEEEPSTDRLSAILAACPELCWLTTPGQLGHWRTHMETSPLQTAARFELIAACGEGLTPRLTRWAADSLALSAERVISLWVPSEATAPLTCTYPSAELNQPGSLGLPFPGIEPQIMDDQGKLCRVNIGGQLAFPASWPAMSRGIWQQPRRFQDLYFSRFPGMFRPSEAGRVDANGFLWFMGRLDDMIMINGFSFRTSEIEGTLEGQAAVAEAAAVVGEDDQGERLFLFIAPSAAHNTVEEIEALQRLLIDSIKKRIGEFALNLEFIFVRALPRTFTGKVARRVLRRVAAGKVEDHEDIGHVANPDTVKELLRVKGN